MCLHSNVHTIIINTVLVDKSHYRMNTLQYTLDTLNLNILDDSLINT